MQLIVENFVTMVFIIKGAVRRYCLLREAV